VQQKFNAFCIPLKIEVNKNSNLIENGFPQFEGISAFVLVKDAHENLIRLQSAGGRKVGGESVEGGQELGVEIFCRQLHSHAPRIDCGDKYVPQQQAIFFGFDHFLCFLVDAIIQVLHQIAQINVLLHSLQDTNI